jgi:hypothetical protein
MDYIKNQKNNNNKKTSSQDTKSKYIITSYILKSSPIDGFLLL